MSTVLITGASGGIGSAMALAFAKEGLDVAVHYYKDRASAEKLADEIRALGQRAEIFQADLSSAEAADAMAKKVSDLMGPVEILVNNAGMDDWGLFQDLSSERWKLLMDTNLTSVYGVTRALIPSMVEAKKGCIINISSMWGIAGGSCEAAYSAGKGAIIALTKALAKELGPSGIRVNCIAPGVIDTKMNAAFSPADLKALADETPLGRIGKPQDVADAAVFLASEKAAFITGQTLCVDGGIIL